MHERLHCQQHGKGQPGLIVCVHVLDGGPIAHYSEPDAGGGIEGLGEALCTACVTVMNTPRGLEVVKLVCLSCFRQIMAGRS
jgi:hypothetical protein